ncbi:MAG TPA: TetR family transcriptional regulator C-terminal domain-containing protein [Solirubrobacterales bacterium]|nr:TetR family transcriptional regulator C-terminal domain-containing protein [Solirubrobacterales bacterium]
MSPRPQIDHIRKPQILAAAAEVVAERGVAATRIADVAKLAGTSAPAVLYWFESKDRMLVEALGFAEERFYTELAERLEALETPGERLRLLIEASAAAHDWTLWMEMWTWALRDAASSEARRALDERWRREIERQVADGQRRGEFDRSDPPERVAMILAALIDGLAVQATLRDPAMPAARMLELSLEIAERLVGAKLPELDRARDQGERALLAGGG